MTREADIALNAGGPRRGGWIQTFTGKAFWPLDARADEVDITDIAHALSMLCRYAGHVRKFYSVAQHCVLMSEAVAPENALQALLHDATEAYVVDLPTPVKRYMPDYIATEFDLWQVIAEHFGVDPELPDEVHSADARIVIDERAALMGKVFRSWGAIDGQKPLGVEIRSWSPAEAESRYLERFEILNKTPRTISDRRGGA
jgi:5'-deoxynucleotidase YfbR-like HD superfamily hydrolase